MFTIFEIGTKKLLTDARNLSGIEIEHTYSQFFVVNETNENPIR